MPNKKTSRVGDVLVFKWESNDLGTELGTTQLNHFSLNVGMAFPIVDGLIYGSYVIAVRFEVKANRRQPQNDPSYRGQIQFDSLELEKICGPFIPSNVPVPSFVSGNFNLWLYGISSRNYGLEATRLQLPIAIQTHPVTIIYTSYQGSQETLVPSVGFGISNGIGATAKYLSYQYLGDCQKTLSTINQNIRSYYPPSWFV